MRKLTTMVIMMALTLIMVGGCTKNKEAVAKDTSAQQITKNRYLDFQDVLVPGELERVEGETFISNSYGRLMLTGRVYGDSAAKFFKSAMANDGWTFQNEYTYKNSTKIFFSKIDKTSSILITENPFGARIEIWVTPQKIQ
jgi:hypothetical protein